MSDVVTVLLDLPTTIKSFVRENPDDSMTVVVNAKLSAEDRLQRYKHEVDHIKHGDMDSGESVQRIESVAHGYG